MPVSRPSPKRRLGAGSPSACRRGPGGGPRSSNAPAREASSSTDETRQVPSSASSHGPTSPGAKEWTEPTTPLRVRNVPSSVSRNADCTSASAQTLPAPRLSATWSACSAAVEASQGISEAFSTGSQDQ
jgi:hypothetical protein